MGPLGFFLLGISILAALLLGARWFINADPKTIVKTLKWGALSIVALLLVFALLTGRLHIGLPALLALILLWRRIRMGGFRGFGSTPSRGRSSDVETDYIEISLDHDTGEMVGRVRKGAFANRQLSELSFEDLLVLYRECALADQDGARILETFLERNHEEAWQAARDAADAHGSEADGRPLNRDEAYEILGLEPGASVEEIKEAHRRLMQKIHPDHGGSTYLAAKINQAKELLLQT